jgi:hypothetical protein
MQRVDAQRAKHEARTASRRRRSGSSSARPCCGSR